MNAPFTLKQIEKLKWWQNSEVVHPLACHCKVPQDDRILIPTTDGLVCPNCGFNQTWCPDLCFEVEGLQRWEEDIKEKLKV